MIHQIRRGPRITGPKCPPHIVEEIELWARKSGRGVEGVHFVPVGGWMARLALRPNDPRMIAYREGRAAEPDTEDVWFHFPNPEYGKVPGVPEYLRLDLRAIGREKVREFLEKGDTWSQRGEFKSLVEQAAIAHEINEGRRKKVKDDARQDVVQKLKRRWFFQRPQVQVGIDL